MWPSMMVPIVNTLLFGFLSIWWFEELQWKRSRKTQTDKGARLWIAELVAPEISSGQPPKHLRG
jgi:hypothetical protein